MSNFIVSARKYRPKEFVDVVGQSIITDTLEKAIENEQLAQAMLFCGPRGVGKTTCARIFAKKINEHFTENIEDKDFSFNIFELDAASNNSVEGIRNLTEQVRFAPQNGKYKVYIIDEVHMLSQGAFNAFLKTLEEPPAHAIFILATTEKHKIIPTILSRCQIFDFKRITIQDICDHLIRIAELENIEADPASLYMIAQKADGALRDALSMFDRVATFGQGKINTDAVAQTLNVLDYNTYFELTDAAVKGDISSLLLQYNEILNLGFDSSLFLSGFSKHMRDLLVAKNNETVSLLEVPQEIQAKYIDQANNVSLPFITDTLTICNQAEGRYKGSNNGRLLIEITLMQIGSLMTGAEKKN